MTAPTRRQTIAGLAALTLLPPSRADAQSPSARVDRLSALEARNGGRLGVAVLDTASGAILAAHRIDERFAMCSTFKALAAACVLHRVDRGQESLDRRIHYTRKDLVTYSPVTEKHVPAGMTVSGLCEAAVTLSDNTAGNLLLDSFGGPAGLTSFAREMGDDTTRLDRREPDLNEATPGDPRDTSTPRAFATLLAKLTVGDALTPASRETLVRWLVDCKTGDQRIRAGLPKSWRVGDKTGSGGHNGTNDVAIAWPASRPPIIIAAFYAESPASPEVRNVVLAEVGRVAADAVG